jgi:hypothetical protein
MEMDMYEHLMVMNYEHEGLIVTDVQAHMAESGAIVKHSLWINKHFDTQPWMMVIVSTPGGSEPITYPGKGAWLYWQDFMRTIPPVRRKKARQTFDEFNRYYKLGDLGPDDALAALMIPEG